MKRLLLLSVGLACISGLANAQTNADYPPDAGPGVCFARVLIPEITEIETEQVIDRAESTEINYTPAVYETVTEQVLVKEATTSLKVIPAVFETITEQVIKTPERIETVVIPAEYETYTEQVLVRAAYVTWKPGNGLFGRSTLINASGPVGSNENTDLATGELLCRVEVPAEYETVSRTRIKTPERSETKTIPATYETVTRQVVATAPQVVEEVIPAVFETVTVQRLVSAAREEVVVIPATYKTLERRVAKGGGGLEWREVLCDTNAAPQKIAEVQRALVAKGYQTSVDGTFGPSTLDAMEAYQRANGLPVGYLTISTVQSLGVVPF